MSSSYMFSPCDKNHNHCDDVNVCEHVAVPGIKRLVRSEIRFAVQNHSPSDRRRMLDPAVWINYRADSRICGTNLISTVLDCPHNAHPQMLEGSGGLTEPSIIRDHHQHFRTTLHKLTDKIR